ncbi:MAG TPA: helix-turn-helix transcriptional regulator [Alphaproteobacteria bacterium]|jgi:transcriptional regulator with XRE-family HTH domain
MTPFGAKLRELRKLRGVTLKEMAESLEISSAYLSALEHGKRGRPSPMLVRQICTFFTIIWDDAEELGRLVRVSHPRVAVDTAGLSPRATELANLLAERIGDLDEDELDALVARLRAIKPKRGR